MIPSVSREAELELTDAARHYAENAGKDLGLALIDEFEAGLQLLCEQPQLGAVAQQTSLTPAPIPLQHHLLYEWGLSSRDCFGHHRRKPQYWSGRT
jgi:plasmid stabilization system protein ParE